LVLIRRADSKPVLGVLLIDTNQTHEMCPVRLPLPSVARTEQNPFMQHWRKTPACLMSNASWLAFHLVGCGRLTDIKETTRESCLKVPLRRGRSVKYDGEASAGRGSIHATNRSSDDV